MGTTQGRPSHATGYEARGRPPQVATRLRSEPPHAVRPQQMRPRHRHTNPHAPARSEHQQLARRPSRRCSRPRSREAAPRPACAGVSFTRARTSAQALFSSGASAASAARTSSSTRACSSASGAPSRGAHNAARSVDPALLVHENASAMRSTHRTRRGTPRSTRASVSAEPSHVTERTFQRTCSISPHHAAHLTQIVHRRRAPATRVELARAQRHALHRDAHVHEQAVRRARRHKRATPPHHIAPNSMRRAMCLGRRVRHCMGPRHGAHGCRPLRAARGRERRGPCVSAERSLARPGRGRRACDRSHERVPGATVGADAGAYARRRY